MRKILAVALWISLACVAQTQTHTFCPTDAACTWTGAQTLQVPILGNYTVATLPTPHAYQEAFVSDGASANDCTVGGGSSKVLCYYNGSIWTASSNGGAPSGSAGGSLTGTFPNPTFAPGISNTWTAVQTAPLLDKGGAVYNVSAYGNNIQTTIAAAGTGGHVYIPSGTYNITSAINPLQDQVIECSAGDILGAGGAVIKPSGAIWAFANPNADAVSGTGNGIRNVVVKNCTFDISGDPTNSLGAIRLKGIAWSQFYNINIHAKNNVHPAMTQDGSNFAHNNGDYNNDFYSLNLYDDSPSQTSTGTGIYITGSGGSNDNHFFGGSVNDFGVSVLIDDGNNNQFYGTDLEGWVTNCIHLASGATINLFSKTRCEAAAANVNTSILVDSGTYGNQIDAYQSCALCTFTTDNSGGKNNYNNAIFGPAATATNVSVISDHFNTTLVGINKNPDFFDSYRYGGVDVHGEIATDRKLMIGAISAGGWSEITSVASAQRTLRIPDASGDIPVTGAANTFSNNQYIAQPNTADNTHNYTSSLLEFVASYWNGAAAASDNFYMENVPSSGTNPTTTFTIGHSGSSGGSFLNLAGSNTLLTSVTPATNANNYASPYFQWYSYYWDGAASQADKWSFQPVLAAGTNPTSTLTLTHVGSSGAASLSLPTVAITTLSVTNTPTFPTASIGDNSTKGATTAYVDRVSPSGVCYNIKSSDTIPYVLTGIASATEIAKYTLPVLTANATVTLLGGNLFGTTGNAGTTTLTSFIGTTQLLATGAITRNNAWYFYTAGFTNINSASLQTAWTNSGNSGSGSTLGAFGTYAVNTGSATSFIIKATPTNSSDTWTFYAPTVMVCNGN